MRLLSQKRLLSSVRMRRMKRGRRPSGLPALAGLDSEMESRVQGARKAKADALPARRRERRKTAKEGEKAAIRFVNRTQSFRAALSTFPNGERLFGDRPRSRAVFVRFLSFIRSTLSIRTKVLVSGPFCNQPISKSMSFTVTFLPSAKRRPLDPIFHFAMFLTTMLAHCSDTFLAEIPCF